MKRRTIGTSALGTALVAALLTASPSAAQDLLTCNGLPVTVMGSDDSDVITGTAGDDVIWGGKGHDVINGLGGNDTICGDSGRDKIDGGAGDDWISGGSHRDRIKGGGGNDNIRGGVAKDTIRSGHGNDRIWGNTGDDTIIAGSGNDWIKAGVGADLVWGGTGNDTLNGGDDADRCDDQDTGRFIGCEWTLAAAAYGLPDMDPALVTCDFDYRQVNWVAEDAADTQNAWNEAAGQGCTAPWVSLDSTFWQSGSIHAGALGLDNFNISFDTRDTPLEWRDNTIEKSASHRIARSEAGSNGACVEGGSTIFMTEYHPGAFGTRAAFHAELIADGMPELPTTGSSWAGGIDFPEEDTVACRAVGVITLDRATYSIHSDNMTDLTATMSAILLANGDSFAPLD